MSALSLLATPAPGVRRPTLEASFGSGSAEEWARALVALRVETGLAPFVDAVEVRLAPGAGAPAVSVGDSGSISLGYEDAGNELVFTGEVDLLRRSVAGPARLVGVNGGAKLARLRVNQSYQKQKAGEIVGDLISRAGVTAGAIDDGVEFPFYVVDDRRSVLEHIAIMARKCGYQAWFTPENELNFQSPATGQPVETFTYGENVLSLQGPEAAPVIGSLITLGEGAAGSQGAQAWSWLLKDPSPVKGTAGAGAPQRARTDASLRSAGAAQAAAEAALSETALVQSSGVLQAPGAPRVTPGCGIEIAAAPEGALNGACLVRRVCHRFTKQGGFTTRIVFSKTGAAAGLGGLAGGLL